MKPVQLPFSLVAAVSAIGQRPGLGGPLPIPAQRRWLELMAATLPEPAGTVARPVTVGGRPGLRVTVGATERSHAIVHLHGGAYTVGSPKTHRALAAFLAKQSGAAVYLPDYRLAPENPFPAALEDAVAACEQVAADHQSYALSGDSAGGGLAVATARRLIDAAAASPVALALISPWVDPLGRATGRKRDMVVRDSWGKACAALYLGTGDGADPGFAPGRGNLAGLPPTIVHIGKREVQLEQVSEFAGALRAAGVEVRLHEFDRLWHVGHAVAGLLAEADRAVAELGEFVREQFDRQPAQPGAFGAG
ncbi:MAG: alpha/beta hydrolase [Jatrophihabitantaceae bacterium]